MISWAELTQYLVAFLVLLASVFTLLGSFSLARLPDFYMRLHGPTKTTSLGVGGMAIASAVHFSTSAPGISLHELTLTLFLFITAPLSAHLLAKVALHLAEEPLPPEER